MVIGFGDCQLPAKARASKSITTDAFLGGIIEVVLISSIVEMVIEI